MTQEINSTDDFHIEPITVSMADAERLTGLSRVTIYRLIAGERLVCVKAGAKSLVTMASLRAYLDALPRFVGKSGRAA